MDSRFRGNDGWGRGRALRRRRRGALRWARGPRLPPWLRGGPSSQSEFSRGEKRPEGARPLSSLPHRGRGRREGRPQGAPLREGWIPAFAGMTDGGGLRKGPRWVGKPEAAPSGRPRACRRAPSLSLPHRGRGRREGGIPASAGMTDGGGLRKGPRWVGKPEAAPFGRPRACRRAPSLSLPHRGRGRREGGIPAFAGMTVCCADITGYRGVMVSLPGPERGQGADRAMAFYARRALCGFGGGV